MAPVDPEVAAALEAWGEDGWSIPLETKAPAEACRAQDDTLAEIARAKSSGWQLSRSASEPQRPQSEQGKRGKPASQRFSAEELQCFKTRPLPSTEFDQKSHVYWQTFGELRRNLSNDNWHTLPVLKGQFYQHSRFKESLGGPTAAEQARALEKAKRLLIEKKKAEEVQPLANEAFVGDVLNRIFPRNKNAKKGEEQPGRGGRHGRRQSMAFNLGGRRASLSAPSRPMRESASTPNPSFKAKSSQPSSIRSPLSPLLISPVGARGAMEEFRRAILEKFTTIKEAFETFMKDLPDRQITKLELSRTLARHGFEWQTKDARDAIFDRLDFKSVGRVTMVGFYVIVEASAPVRNVEDLRRRWLASQFGSMHQAIMTMVENSTHALSQRLTLQEFGELLLRVNVNDPEEHQALFKSIHYSDKGDKGDKAERHHEKHHEKHERHEKGRTARVTIGDLASAVAVVSPCLLLEDLRDRLHKRYGGDFKKAFADLDMDGSGSIDQQEFVVKAMDRLHLTQMEAQKMFREIDVDGSKEISRTEFVCAIGLSEPSLFLEDLRRKVRQRFRSFKAQFANAFHDSALNECESAPRLSLQNFQELLLPLSMSEKETKVLFNLIDIDHDGHLSVREFVRGVRHFAPSAVIEDLRVICCQQHEHITDAFVGMDYLKVLDSNAFAEYLVEAGLCDGKDFSDIRLAELQAGVPAQALFDILDVANNGEASIGRLLAALQSCGAGTTARLSAEDLDVRAKNDVKTDLAPMHKLVTDLKLQARQGMRYSEEDNQDAVADEKGSTRIFDAMLEQLDLTLESYGVSKTAEDGAAVQTYRGPPRLKTLLYEDVLKQYSYHHQRAAKPAQAKRPIHTASNGTQDSWLRIWANLKKSPKKPERNLEGDLQSYYQSAALKLSHDGPLLHGIEQRLCHDPFLSKHASDGAFLSS